MNLYLRFLDQGFEWKARPLRIIRSSSVEIIEEPIIKRVHNFAEDMQPYERQRVIATRFQWEKLMMTL